jgi:RNase adapter protein RapZ
VGSFIDDVEKFMHARIPEYRASARRYLTVAVGCTGGQHRSVYIVEQLAARFAKVFPEVRVRHSGLPETAQPLSTARAGRAKHSS